MHNILLEEEVAEEVDEEGILEAGGKIVQGEKSDLHCMNCNRDGHDASTCKFPWERSERERNEAKGKTNEKGKGKALESAHYVVAHCNMGVTKDLFNASCYRSGPKI